MVPAAFENAGQISLLTLMPSARRSGLLALGVKDLDDIARDRSALRHS
jgi:hypothetical protein